MKHLQRLIKTSPYYVLKLLGVADSVVKHCVPCQLVNANPSRMLPGKRLRRSHPGAHWEIDFTEVKPAKYRSKYLLVFIDTFSGWVEDYPTKRETATVVAKILEVFPRFGIPKVIGSDNSPS